MGARAWTAVGVTTALVLAWGGYRIKLNREKAAEGEGPGAAQGGPPGASRGGSAGSGPRGGGNGGGSGGRGGGGRTPLVETATAGPRTFSADLEGVATLVSPNRAALAPPVSGVILDLELREGDTVSRGQVVMRIDPADARAAVAQAEAAVAQARSRLAEASLGREATDAQASGEIARTQAALEGARADEAQARGTIQSQIQAAIGTVRDVEGRIGQAQANVADAEAELRAAEAEEANARQFALRQRRLAESGAIAGQVADDAELAVKTRAATTASRRASVTAAKRAVESARAQKRSAESNLAVLRRRATFDAQAAQARRKQAEVAARVARANRSQSSAYRENLDALRSAVRAAEAARDGAVARLNQTVVRSPLTGVVTARNADPGALASPGNAVLTVQSLDPLFAEVRFPVERAGAVSVGMPATVTLSGGASATGSVAKINPAADVASRQFTALIRLSNPDGRLRPGAFGRAKVEAPGRTVAVALPREAVISQGGEDVVNVVKSDGTVERRVVEVGRRDAAFVEIASGVKAGEKAVALSVQRLREGANVRTPDTAPRGGSSGGPRGGSGGGERPR